jgi:hypothetical protein
MRTKTGEVRFGPPLPIVLCELTEKLIADDWARHATPDDGSVYYVLGVAAHDADQVGEPDHLSLSVPHGGQVSVIGEQQVHAQVASVKSPDYYVRQWRKPLEATGIDAREVETFLNAFERGDDFSPLVSGWHIDQPDRFNAFINLLRALVLRRGVPVDELATESEKRQEIGTAIEKMYLEEISRLFKSIVTRAGPLEPLEFQDAQLNEASRCYLYGFFKAAVLLSASALEKRLRDAIGLVGLDQVGAKSKEQKGFYGPLVEVAAERGVLGPRERLGQDPAFASYARGVFQFRNKVAHEGHEPQSHEAEETLTKTRQVVEFVRDRQS